jgi:hypothetical protein
MESARPHATQHGACASQLQRRPGETRRVSDDQEAFERAKRAREELNEVWQRGAQQSAEGRRALHGLKEALEALTDSTQRPKAKLPRPSPVSPIASQNLLGFACARATWCDAYEPRRYRARTTAARRPFPHAA